MRVSSVLLIGAALAGCKISDAHFTGPGVFDDAPTGSGDSKLNDAPPDTPAVAATTAYGLAFNSGITRLRRDAMTGALMVLTTFTTTNTGYLSFVRGPTGKVYTFEGMTSGAVTTWVPDGTGNLSEGPITGVGNCGSPNHAVMRPGGNYIVVGCSNGPMSILPLDAMGNAGNALMKPLGQQQPSFAFTSDGRCMYAVDPAGQSVFAYTATAADVVQSQTAGTAFGPRDLVVSRDNLQLFVLSVDASGQSSISTYIINTDCSLNPAGMMPVGTQATELAMHPAGTYLWALGQNVYSYAIGPGGTLAAVTGSPTTPIAGAILFDVVVDPTLPNVAYIHQSGGVITSPINNGLLPGGPNTPFGQGATYGFMLAP